MRSSFAADWAFGIVGAIEKIVGEKFPSEVHRWPVLQGFNFDAYSLSQSQFSIIIRDKLSGINAGPGVPQPFPHNDHPQVPVTAENIDQWLNYLVRKFELRGDDVGMILPIHDSGRSDAASDFNMFSTEERQLWDHQLMFAIARQMTGLKLSLQSTPTQPTYVNVSGTGARVYIQSNDSSVNVVSEATPELFRQMITAIQTANEDAAAISKLETAVEEMRKTYGTPQFARRYTAFMSVLADHMQVFGSIIGPFLPALARLVT